MKHDLPPAGLATRPRLRGGDAGAIVLFGTIAALYFTRDIPIPFAFALILAFLLTPVVALLQRLHTGRVVGVASLRVRAGAGHVQADPGTVSETQIRVGVCVWGFSGDTHKAKARFERTPPDRLCTSLAEAVEHVQELVRPKPEATPLLA